jgi:hypothetical protein
VGGYAVMKYSEPRFTKDLDLFIAVDLSNAANVFNALQEFGAPLKNLSPSNFTDKNHYYQMGKPPVRVDVLMSIDGVEFESAWQNREIVKIDDLDMVFIGKHDLIVNKRAAGRPQDLIDLEALLNT